MYSTIDDLDKLDRALYGEKILNKKSIDLMFTPHILMTNASRAHSYGWFIDKKCNQRVVEYSCSLVGYLSRIMRFIDDNSTIIVLTNVENRDQLGKIYDDLPEILFKG